MPAVSIIMPVYNGERFLSEAIDSVVGQSHGDFELIAVDDGSSDRTTEILKRYAKRDARIVVVEQARQGIVSALNCGIALSRGKYIARMDADDVSLPNRLAIQCALMDSQPKIVVCGSNIIRFGSKAGLLQTAESDAACRSLVNIESCFAHPSVMMRACTLRSNSIAYRLDSEFSEDYRLWSELANFGELRNIQEPLLKYRVHAGQVSNQKIVAQRRAHARIAQANLLSNGINLTTEEIADLLWPTKHGIRDAIRYCASLAEFSQRLAAGGHLEPFLKRRLSRIRLKNVLSHLA